MNGVLQINDVQVNPRGGPGETKTAVFTVTLSPEQDVPVTAQLKTRDFTEYKSAHAEALPGVDYTETSGEVTFAPGETAKSFSVPVFGSASEPTKVFGATLTTDSGATIFRDTGACLLVSGPQRR